MSEYQRAIAEFRNEVDRLAATYLREGLSPHDALYRARTETLHRRQQKARQAKPRTSLSEILGKVVGGARG